MNRNFIPITSTGKMYQHVTIFFLLGAAALIIYWNVGGLNFILFDDGLYVFQNEKVMHGLTPDSILWAFNLSKEGGNQAYWHPLTWLSLMADCQLFGLNPGKHHLVNLSIHIINTLLLYLLFQQMTGAIWKSAFVAALFAVHPLNVDTVAWIAERKNVLSTLFWLLTMISYAYYARRATWARYLLVFICMAAGLLAKPMLVTLPCVLLLMDFWPMGRLIITGEKINPTGPFQPSSPIRLIIEKIPLLGLSFASIIASMLSLQHHNQIVTQHTAPMTLRVENVFISYIEYLGKIFWPHQLAIYYPFPNAIPFWQISGAIILLAVIFALVIFFVKRAPYLAVGWLWFMGTLVPVIGIIQEGLWPAIADRWTYVPGIGIFIIVSWCGSALLQKISKKRAIRAMAALTVLAALMLVSHNQLKYWKNSITLFSHALDVTENNDVAHFNLGVALGVKGDTDQAIHHFNEGIKINPNMAEGYNNLGNALLQKGMVDQAIAHIRHALEIDPELIQGHTNLGDALIKKGQFDSAIEQFNRALELNPEMVQSYINLGNALMKKGQIDSAIEQFNRALVLNPEMVQAHADLGNALMEKGLIDSAIEQFNRALELSPKQSEVHIKLGNAFTRKGKFDQAIRQFRQAIALNPKSPIAHNNLGIALAEKGLIDQAIGAFHQALAIDPGYTEVHNNLGNALLRKGQLDEALYHYETVIAENQKGTNAVKNRNALLSLLKPADQIKILFKTAVRFSGEKKYDHAVALFQKILTISPDNSSTYYNISCLYALQNQKEQAVQWLKQAMDHGYANWDKLKSDPDLDNIRDEPGYQSLVGDH